MGEAAEHLDHESLTSGPPVLKPLPMAPALPDRATGKKAAKWQWRADLKWVFGIPFTFILGLLLVVVAMFSITSRGNSVRTITEVQQALLSRPELVSQFNAGAPQLAALINSPDFATLVYEDPTLLDNAIAAIPDPAQSAGAGGEAQEGSVDAARSAGSIKGAAQAYSIPIRFLNAGVHESLGAVLTVLSLAMLLTGIPFLLLSRRTGRLVSPGVSLAVASWTPLLLLSLVHEGVKGNLDETQASMGGGEEAVVSQAALDAVRPLVEGVFGPAVSIYQTFAFISAGLFVIAAAIFAVMKARGRLSAPARTPSPQL